MQFKSFESITYTDTLYSYTEYYNKYIFVYAAYDRISQHVCKSKPGSVKFTDRLEAS